MVSAQDQNHGAAPIDVLAPSNAVAPGTPSGASQPGRLYMGSGVPSNSAGNNGDFYLRTDTPGTSSQRIYIKSAGSWTALAV